MTKMLTGDYPRFSLNCLLDIISRVCSSFEIAFFESSAATRRSVNGYQVAVIPVIYKAHATFIQIDFIFKL